MLLTLNITDLAIDEKLSKGTFIITGGTNNPLVPGNGPSLAAFATAQANLDTADAAVVAARETLRLRIIERDAAEAAWNTKLRMLGGFTQWATGGDRTAIVSAGFDVRAARTPVPVLTAPENVQARTNGSPGVTKLTWNPLVGAVIYFVEQSPSPMTADSWTARAPSTKASCEIDGAEPGKEYWYRIAGVNANGQGPWSAPACRSVM